MSKTKDRDQRMNSRGKCKIAMIQSMSTPLKSIFVSFMLTFLLILFLWRYRFWPKVIIFDHASGGDSKKYPFIKLEFEFAKFGRILVMKMHQKLSHFGELNDCFSIPEVWLRPDTVATPWHIIKTTVVDFKSHIKSLMDQIWLTEISWNRYFEVFSVPYCIPVGFWALNTNFQMWKRPWNREIAFSRSLGHLDGSLKIALPKTEDFPKKWLLDKIKCKFVTLHNERFCYIVGYQISIKSTPVLSWLDLMLKKNCN